MTFEEYLSSLKGKAVGVIGVGVSQPSPDRKTPGAGDRRHRPG